MAKKSKLEKALSALDKGELVEIILGHTAEDIKFGAALRMEYVSQGMSKAELKNQISAALDEEMEDRGYVPWNRTWEACSGAESVLEKAEDYFKKGDFRRALTAAEAVLEETVSALEDVDDSSGNFGMCIDSSLEILHKAVKKKLDEETRKEFFEYLLGEWDHERYQGWSWGLELLGMALDIHSGEAESEKLLEQLATAYKKSKSDPNSRVFNREIFQLYHRALCETGRKKEAEAFFNDNLDLPEFRREAIEKAFKKKKYDRALELIEDGIKTDSDWMGLKKEWLEWRLKVYQSLNDRGKVREFSREFLLDSDKEYYAIYKNTFLKAEWPSVYEKLVKKLFDELERNRKSSTLLGYILSKEKELEKLLKLTEIHKESVGSYEKLLLPKYRKEVLATHADNIRQEAARSSSRRAYAQLCEYSLKHLYKIDGADVANKLIQEFKQKYPRRSAMLEELSKLERRH